MFWGEMDEKAFLMVKVKMIILFVCKINTSLAAPGALAYHLQRRTDCST